MSKRFISFMALLFIPFMMSCAAQNDEESGAEALKYNTINADENVTNYYMAFREGDLTLMGQVVSAYSERYTEGELDIQADRYFSSKVIVAPTGENTSGNDGSWNTVHESGTLRCGVIENGRFAFAEKSQEGSPADGYFSSVCKLIGIRLQLKSDIELYTNNEQAVEDLKAGKIDCIIGIDENQASGLAYTFPIAADRLVFYTSRDSVENIANCVTTEPYTKFANGFQIHSETRETMEECFSALENNEDAVDAVICMLSDIKSKKTSGD